MSADYRRWFLLNASPDIRTQIESFPALRPADGRATPLQAVLLTDAELDHTLGLLLLREARSLELHETPAVRETLCDGTAVLRTLEAYCPVEWRPVVPGADVPLGAGLSYRAFDVPTNKPTRFPTGTEQGRVVGYRLTDETNGRAAVYLPGVQELTTAVRAVVGLRNIMYFQFAVSLRCRGCPREATAENPRRCELSPTPQAATPLTKQT
ncbi:MBL fold metallo-hydrolase [Saccharopolyspora soli]|uniref:MBL fold metallo-hydrolase n=1 Tax=Saccharopolyspora soli TaxID=2926618 RepID=UPI001F591721|nr:MBL fold metallo-hydrolase [Saccharopolyspora soli]